jgi:hypothetical protein
MKKFTVNTRNGTSACDHKGLVVHVVCLNGTEISWEFTSKNQALIHARSMSKHSEIYPPEVKPVNVGYYHAYDNLSERDHYCSSRWFDLVFWDGSKWVSPYGEIEDNQNLYWYGLNGSYSLKQYPITGFHKNFRRVSDYPNQRINGYYDPKSLGGEQDD